MFLYMRAPFALQLVEPNTLAEWRGPQMFSPKRKYLAMRLGKVKKKKEKDCFAVNAFHISN